MNERDPEFVTICNSPNKTPEIIYLIERVQNLSRSLRQCAMCAMDHTKGDEAPADIVGLDLEEIPSYIADRISDLEIAVANPEVWALFYDDYHPTFLTVFSSKELAEESLAAVGTDSCYIDEAKISHEKWVKKTMYEATILIANDLLSVLSTEEIVAESNECLGVVGADDVIKELEFGINLIRHRLAATHVNKTEAKGRVVSEKVKLVEYFDKHNLTGVYKETEGHITVRDRQEGEGAFVFVPYKCANKE